MKIATFNINGIKARLPRLVEWLEETQPDVACLQELKSSDETMPTKEIEAAGYGFLYHGQKGFNGVAILAKGTQPVEIQRGLEGEPEDEQSRYLEADVHGLRVASIYLPNGNPQPGPKFDYKLRWMARLRERAKVLLASEIPTILTGDYNVIPHDDDVWDPRVMATDALMQPESRDAWFRLLGDGWTDALRSRHPAGGYLDLLGLSGRRLAARSWLSHRPSAAQPRARRPAGRCRRRQGSSRPRKGERPRPDMGGARLTRQSGLS
jgi:exodeoxyribonuclease-3